MNNLNIIIVEDDILTKQTLVYALKKQQKIADVKAFGNGKECVDYIKLNTVDVILMDIDMPVMNGIEATQEIKKMNSKIPIIMLTAHSEKEKVLSSFSSGANAYCVKEIKTAELMQVIDIVLDGGIWFDKQIAGFIFEVMKEIESNKPDAKEQSDKITDLKITNAEYKILKLIAEGSSNKQIADELIISLYTVKNHVANIIKKLSVTDRTQIAVYAYKNNLLA